MSGEPKTTTAAPLKRVPVIVRSWDGPNSRIGLELDLSQIPWGPFDALGKRLSILLPVAEEYTPSEAGSESQVERALRHVEHAADRCAEFAQLANGNQALWLRSQETWEWIRKYLTTLWVDVEVDGKGSLSAPLSSPEGREGEKAGTPVPALPGAASTLRVAAQALRATPLSLWSEATGATLDLEAPTREEAVQTLLGVARILSGQSAEGAEAIGGSGFPSPRYSKEPQLPDPSQPPASRSEPSPEADPDQLPFEFARGYDEGYQMGRRVGLALGTRKG